MINKELIAQQASKQGLAKEIDLPDQLTQFRLNLLLQVFVDERFKKNPITNPQLRAEYDEQIKVIGNDGNGFQYRISQIVQEKELEAISLISRIQKGESFSKLAQEYSVDKSSRSQGGSLGGALPAQVIPAIANVLPRMNKGAITTSPIKILAGWAIIKLDEKRPFKIANFEEAKPQLNNAIVHKYLNATINSLRSSARIIQ